MDGAVIALEGDIDAGVAHAVGVLLAVVEQRVVPAHRDERGREPVSDVASSGLASGSSTSAGVPTYCSKYQRIVSAERPYPDAFSSNDGVSVRRSVTGYTSIWKAMAGPPASARELRDHRREVGARAVADDRDPRRVAAELGRMGDRPLQGGQGVVDRGGELVLGGEAVVDAHDDHAGLIGQYPALVVVGVEVAHDEAAAVEEDRDAERGVVRGGVDP